MRKTPPQWLVNNFSERKEEIAEGSITKIENSKWVEDTALCETIHTDLMTLLDEEDSSENITQREVSASHGRRSVVKDSVKPSEYDAEMILRVNFPIDCSLDTTYRSISARYGRRSQSRTMTPNAISNQTIETVGASNIQPYFHSNNNTVDGENRHSNEVTTTSKMKVTTVTDTNSHLEESWESLNVFNKKHKGRIITRQDNGESVACSSSPFPDDVSTTDLEDFIVPHLPRGQFMVFDITATWGDKHYVGLNGIEIFTSSGQTVRIKELTANPSDINILPEYEKDPRVVGNLFGSVNRTHDDMYLWLAPFNPGSHHYIYVKFFEIETISMIRIWVRIAKTGFL